MRIPALVAAALLVLGETAASAQNVSPSIVTPPSCELCPARRPGRALIQTTVINGIYELANLARGQATAHISPSSWWANMSHGMEWDRDDFMVNQIGHPYQGNNYFNSGRANGLSFWESSAVTAFGSATWEYFGETNKASLNDFINTTLGGIALGEMFHRTAWLIRDTTKSGGARKKGELLALAIDPVTGINRFISGDASKVGEAPPELMPARLGGYVSAGVLWRGSNEKLIDSAGQPFGELDMLYGDLRQGRSRTPFDAFGVSMRLGGGGGMSEVRVRGRLLGQPMKGTQFSVEQAYDFQGNDAYHFGAQSFEGTFYQAKRLSPSVSLVVSATGGLTALGAIDSRPESLPPDQVDDPNAPQGVETGTRVYDYGPGSTFGGAASLTRNGLPFAVARYEAHHLFVLDGDRANHFLQRVRLDLVAPLGRKIGLGASGEYFSRATYYRNSGEYRTHYPEVRGYLTYTFAPEPEVADVAAPPAEAPSTESKGWFVFGGTATTQLGNCRDCEEKGAYQHTAGVIAIAGMHIRGRMDGGVEAAWIPLTRSDGLEIRTTAVEGVAQYRPWAGSGFFVKGGMGMAFVRNWTYGSGDDGPPYTSKALAVTYGAGWNFQLKPTIGLQLFGQQHVIGLGDFKSDFGVVENVIGNLWSAGAAIVIR